MVIENSRCFVELFVETSDAGQTTGRGIAYPDVAEPKSRSPTASGGYVQRERPPIQRSGHPTRNGQSKEKKKIEQKFD